MTKSQIIAALIRAGWTRQAALEKAREIIGPHGVGGFADEARVEAATGLRGFGHPVLSADPIPETLRPDWNPPTRINIEEIPSGSQV